MITELFFTAIIIAAIAALSALVANKARPDRTIWDLTNVILKWLISATLLLMVVGCVLISRTGCAPDDLACDMPAMAAAGVAYLGVLILIALVLVGVPVAYLVLRLLRRK